MPRAERHLNSFASSLAACESLASQGEARLLRRADAISRWSVAQQLDHIVEAAKYCLNFASQVSHGEGEDAASAGKTKFIGRVILVTGWIPRGKGKAPQVVVPEDEPDLDRLANRLAGLRVECGALADRSLALDTAECVARHPLLGAFTACDWLRFAGVHTRHHLKIVRDILGAG